MDPFALLDDDAADQINFAQAVEALATGDPKRVRAADPEWRKRHACDHPPCYLSEGWSADHFDAYMLLWSCMIVGKVMTTDKHGEPHSSMRYLDSSWLYANVAAGAVRGPYDERGNSMWPVFDVLSLVEDGTRLSVPDLEDLIRERDQRAEASVETPDETTPEPAPNARQAQVKKTPVKTPPIKAEPPPLPKWLENDPSKPGRGARALWKEFGGKWPAEALGHRLSVWEAECVIVKHCPDIYPDRHLDEQEPMRSTHDAISLLKRAIHELRTKNH
jgi:hypothetical protein